MSESHESMQVPGRVYIIAAQVGSGCVGRASRAGQWSHFTLHMLLPAFFTPTHYAVIQRWKKLSKMQLYQVGHTMQTVVGRRNYVTVFHVAGRLPVEDLQLCTNWHGRWAVQLIEWSDYYVGGFRKTVPRKTAENTVKYHGGSVGSVIANHRGSGENSVTVTTLLMTSSNYSIAHCSSCKKICLCIQCILHFSMCCIVMSWNVWHFSQWKVTLKLLQGGPKKWIIFKST